MVLYTQIMGAFGVISAGAAGVAPALAAGTANAVMVAAGALVVILTIVLVFLMVLRNNGASRGAAKGLGYDAQRGPIGQPHADADAMARGAQGAGWQNDDMAFQGPGAAAGRPGTPAWGQQPAQDFPADGGGRWGAATGGQSAGAAWGANAGGVNAGGWDDQGGGGQVGVGAPPWAAGAVNAAGGPAMGMASAADQWPPAQPSTQPGGWGAPQAAPGRQGFGRDWGDAPAQPAPAQQTPSRAPWEQQDAGGWGAPAGGAVSGGPALGGAGGANGGWGAPAPASGAPVSGQPANTSDWASSWGASSAPSQPMQPPAPRGATPPPMGGQAMGQMGQMGPGAYPQPGAFGGAAPSSQGQGFGEPDKTRVVRPGGQGLGLIVVRQGKEPGRIYEARKDRLTIGRSRESDIFLEDLAVSRLHTTINHDGAGHYLLRDEGSANGTYVNSERVSERVLEEGDEIQVGQTVLAFVRR